MSSFYRQTVQITDELKMGRGKQIRYVQGDADAVMIHHHGQWHRVPLGGLVAGEIGHFRVKSVHTHRHTNAVFEIGERTIDTIPAVDEGAKLRDQIRIGVEWNNYPAGGDRDVFFVAGEDQTIRVATEDMTDLKVFAMNLPSEADKATFVEDAANVITTFNPYGVQASDLLLTPVAMDIQGQGNKGSLIDLRAPFPLTGKQVLRVRHIGALTSHNYSYFTADILGRNNA